MKSKKVFCFSAVLLIISEGWEPLGAQNPEWKVYTNGNNITALAEEGNFLWVGTTGGLVRLDKTTGEGEFYNNANSGLPSNIIRDIDVDSLGNKWVLTVGWEGSMSLSRFNGTEWLTYDTSNFRMAGSLIDVSVDDRGTVWAAYSNWSPNQSGLAKFDGNSWTDYRVPDSLGQLEGVTALAVDKNCDAWIGLRNGLLTFDGSNWTLFNESNSGLSCNDITCLAIDDSGSVWIGTSDWSGSMNTLSKFDGANWATYSPPISQLHSHIINCIETDKLGNKWIGTYGGLVRLNEPNWTVYDTSNSGIPYDAVGALLCDHDGNISVGTGGNVRYAIESRMGRGLAMFDGNSWTTLSTSASGLPYNMVKCLAIDQSGTKWIGSNSAPPGGNTIIWGYEGAMVTFDDARWIQRHTTSTINSYCYNCVVIDKYGDKWIGTSGDGLLKFVGDNMISYNMSNSPLPANDVTAIAIDHNGNMWIGLRSAGLVKFDGTQWSIFNSANSQLPANEVNCVATDLYDNLWLATYRGLTKFNGKEWVTYNTSNSGLPSEDISGLAADAKGNVWISTSWHGIANFNGSRWIVYDSSDCSSLVDYITCLAIDPGGDVWIGSFYSGGLTRFNGTDWTRLTISSSELPDYHVYSVAFDSIGNTWIGTENGLAVFKKGGIVDGVGQVTAGSSSPDRFVLSQNYPNPFNPTTTISYDLSANCFVCLKVYDVLGREVKTLVNEVKRIGRYEVKFDASGLASGVYFYRIATGTFRKTMKLMVIK